MESSVSDLEPLSKYSGILEESKAGEAFQVFMPFLEEFRSENMSKDNKCLAFTTKF